MKYLINTASALALLAAAAGAAHAQDAASAATGATTDAADISVDAIIVTGTRLGGLRAVDSPAPIEIVDAGTLERTGKPELAQALNQNIPSFNVQPFGGDASNLKMAARLRGLNANHSLILVDGKRRHGTSNLTVSANGGFVGAAAADLTFIPTASISRVEVLTDGAAAQYGSDAVAGVINIILKRADHGGQISVTGGQYFERDGETLSISSNVGFTPFDSAYLNLTAEHREHDYSDRGGPDRRLFTPANLANAAWAQIPGYPYLNHIFGDAKYKLTVGTFSAGWVPSDKFELYSFGSVGVRNAWSQQNYRLPNSAPSLWPQGYTPLIATDELDYAFTAGARGKTFGEWTWDLSSTYGQNQNDVYNLNSANTSLIADTGTSPKNFYNGTFIANQWTTNLDVSRSFDVGFAEPLNLALGAEFRKESYEIQAGDPASRYKTGVQAYPGFSLTDAAKHSRHSYAGYIDVALAPTEKWHIDLAGRYEDFSDFGSTAVGKITTRYDFTDGFAIRGTASTGFRAPTLAEEYYSATTVSPTTAGVRLPPNNAAARLLGIAPLGPEESKNFSIGFVAQTGFGLRATFDVYRIDIDDRIVSTGTIYGLQNKVIRSPQVTAAIIANGNVVDPTVTSTSITTFVNAVDTRTQGAELVLNYASDLGDYGAIDWSLAGNYNETEVTRISAPPAQIAASGQVYLDKTAISYLETVAPKAKVTLGALWRLDKWAVSLTETFYGESSVQQDGGSTNNYVKNAIRPQLITDIDVSYRITDDLKIAVGALNLFDARPDDVDPITYAASLASGGNGVARQNNFSPFGINGGYLYGKVTYAF